ncbi:hypothetical protein ALC57_10048, partial [Trachymyrmex cornetzi]
IKHRCVPMDALLLSSHCRQLCSGHIVMSCRKVSCVVQPLQEKGCHAVPNPRLTVDDGIAGCYDVVYEEITLHRKRSVNSFLDDQFRLVDTVPSQMTIHLVRRARCIGVAHEDLVAGLHVGGKHRTTLHRHQVRWR